MYCIELTKQNYEDIYWKIFGYDFCHTFFKSCGELSSEVEKKYNELTEVTESIDSLFNTGSDKIMALDSLLNADGDKIKNIDSLINKTISNIDSLSNEMKFVQELINQ